MVQDAAGTAEVEFESTAPVEQEIEFSVWNLDPDLPVTFIIDEAPIAVLTTDRQGRATIELEVRLAPASPR